MVPLSSRLSSGAGRKGWPGGFYQDGTSAVVRRFEECSSLTAHTVGRSIIDSCRARRIHPVEAIKYNMGLLRWVNQVGTVEGAGLGTTSFWIHSLRDSTNVFNICDDEKTTLLAWVTLTAVAANIMRAVLPFSAWAARKHGSRVCAPN